MRTGADAQAFVQEHTQTVTLPFLPELPLLLATEVTPLWRATETWLRAKNVEPPFWAFAWAGGQALARYVLDHPELVRGRRVLDFACGGGIVTLAAARAGAARVRAVDIDDLALAALRLNARASGVDDVVVTEHRDPLDDGNDEDGGDGVEILLAGDIFYERPLAERALAWMDRHVARGVRVLAGDGGRAYAPRDRVVERARYEVPTPTDLERGEVIESRVLERLAW